ncbi:MAG: response regulator transcription factor [Chloroflexi bacterium]|nr:response regulator transcription factor [Anaerolineaceae bacterium]NMB89019.1 response regulator transcription factor [Chloroflexota bacterium]
MSNQPIRIIIADDHTVVREGLAAILGDQDDMNLVGIATNGAEAVSLARQHAPDVILMDLVMPHMDGLAAIQAIKAANPEARILVLTSFADDERVFPAIKAGAMGYLLKDTPRQELIQAIHNVARGIISLHPSIARRIIREINQPDEPPSPAVTLTEREMETLRLITRGLSNHEMAVLMNIHENTVAKYVSAVLSKLHLANRTQAALYAIRMGLAGEEPGTPPG